MFNEGGNDITIRGGEIPEGLPYTKKSRNLIEASQKSLRFFRKACRMVRREKEITNDA